MSKTTSIVIALLLVLVLVAPATASTDGESRWLESLDQALAQAAEGDRYVLVDLYAEWCGWCKTLEEKVFSTPLFEEYTRDFVLLRVDVEDGGEGTALQNRFGVQSLPTTLLMDKDMVRVATVRGFAPVSQFLGKLDAGVDNYKGLLAFYNQAKSSDDLKVLDELAGGLHERADGARAAEVYQRIQRLEGEGGPRAARLHYLIADAYRLGRRFADAGQVLERARDLSAKNGDEKLLERVDLLSYYIAQESGDCAEAKKSLEHFLAEHPKSAFFGTAQKTLNELRQGALPLCA